MPPYSPFLRTQLGTYNTFDEYAEGVYCPIYGAFFGVMGATAAMVFTGTFSTRPTRLVHTVCCLWIGGWVVAAGRRQPAAASHGVQPPVPGTTTVLHCA